MSHKPNLGIIMPNMGISKAKPAKPSVIAKSIGVADTLFTATQQRVLGQLFGQPDRSFYAAELIAAGGGSGAVQRELVRLESCGLVEVSRIGNQKHYQASQASPIFEELTGIFRVFTAPESRTRATVAVRNKAVQQVSYDDQSAGVLKKLMVSKTELSALCRRNGIRKLSFFGSVTRDDFRPDSDVDVMVEFAAGRAPSLFGMVDLRDELSTLFKGRKVDVVTPAAMNNAYRRKTIERDLAVAYASH